MSNNKEQQLYEWQQVQEEKAQGSLLEKEPEQQFSYLDRIQMLEDRNYKYNDNGNQKWAKRSTGSTGYMREVIEAMRVLGNSLARKIVLNKEQEEYDDYIQPDFVKLHYKQAISACEEYLCHRNPWTAEGKARKKIVEDFHTQLSLDFHLFSQAVWNHQTGQGEKTNKVHQDENEPLTGAQLLGEIRMQKYRDADEDISITMGGGNTSKLFIVEKSGVKKYFKENEKIAKDWFSALQKEFDGLRNSDIEDSEGEEAKKMSATNKRRGSILLSLIDLIKYKYGKDMERATQEIGISFSGEKILQEILLYGHRHKCNMGYVGNAWNEASVTVEELERCLKDKKTAENHLSDCQMEIKLNENILAGLKEKIKTGRTAELEQGIKDIETLIEDKRKEIEKMEKECSNLNDLEQKLKAELKDTDYQYIINVLDNVKKASRLSDLSPRVAKIKKNEEMSKRNVATSRMAQLLGLNDIIAESQMAELEVKGKKMRGIMMEEAKGETMYMVAKSEDKDGKKVVYSATAYKQLTSLRILDLICAQTDRHDLNYMAETGRDEAGNIIVKSIKGIDNDISFGEFSYNDISQSKDRSVDLANIYEAEKEKWVIPGIDKKLAEKIMNIEPEMIEYGMMDLLSIRELDCLCERFNGIRNLIIKQNNAEGYYRKMGKQFKTIFMESDDDWSKNMKSFAESFKNAPQQIKENIRGMIYINPDFLSL